MIRENYQKLKSLEKLRDNLVHMLIHDLRSPLMGIMGNLDLLNLKLKDSSTAQISKYLDSARCSVSQLSEMVSSVLDVNKLESSKMCVDIQENSWKELIDEVTGNLSLM